MDWFDRTLLLGLNHYAHRSRTFDELIGGIGESDLLKGGIVLCVLWWLWFSRREDIRLVRARLLATIASGVLAVVSGRLLANGLPFRLRPIHESALGFLLPYGESRSHLRAWSSFPSDHAMLFTALGAGIFYVSRRAGTFVLLWTLFVIELPRLYLGLHYPSDLIGGSAIGALLAIVLQQSSVRDGVTRPLLAWHDGHPSSFYAVMYLVTLQVGTLFGDARDLILQLAALLHAHTA
ncbi:MAG TPA: phosphatase PAP2 family protein [Candidatus Acidoferrales bacterium]|nr:phosphatase PAP2 family protein [Candidatus Acidoferrales bacterium]